MKALIQRVSSASVCIDNSVVGEIQGGLLLLLGIEPADTESTADAMVAKVLSYRVFSDPQGKMNLSVKDTNGGLLVVSQFTLVADTRKGLRPSFSRAATPIHAEALYRYFLESAKSQHTKVEAGQFAADMQVSLCNDGPVTFLLTL